MAIIALIEVKTLLNLTDNSKDALISLLIPEVEADYLRIRGAAFDTDDEGATVYPDSSKLTAARMIGHILTNNYGTSSESIGNYSYSLEETNKGYPKSITGSIKRVLSV